MGVAPRAWPERPTRWRNVARLRGEPIWHTSSTGPMSMPSSSDAVATRTFRSPARSRDSSVSRRSFERLPWCAATAVLAHALGEQVGEPLGEAARVHEDQRGAVLGDVPGDAVEDLAPLLVRGDGLERGLRQLDRQVERAAMPEVDDAARRGAVGAVRPSPAPTRRRAMVSMGRWVAERPMRCGRALAERVQPLERQRQVRAALVARHGVDLVDDHRAHAAQALAALRRPSPGGRATRAW